MAKKTTAQRIAEISKKIASITDQVKILSTAKAAGMKITGSTTVEQAASYTASKVEPKEKPKEPEKPEILKVSKQEIIDWLKKQPEYQKLPKDMQDNLISYIDILGIQDIETQQRLLKTLDLAKSQADPYFAEIIRMTVDALNIATGATKADFESQQRDLQEKIRQIKEDLIVGKKRLTVEEQAELARQSRKYEIDLDNLRESAAQVGLTFSTRRALAETRLSTEQQDIVESTQRQFQRQLEDLQTAAARGDLQAQNQLKDYERLYGEQITKLGRTAEQYLGTAGLPGGLAGYQPLGGVRGKIFEEKTSDIMARAQALSGLANPFLK